MGRFVADHGALEGEAATECNRGVIDDPGGRARAPGEGAVTPLGNLGQPGAFSTALERRPREAGPGGGWFGGCYISWNSLRVSCDIT